MAAWIVTVAAVAVLAWWGRQTLEEAAEQEPDGTPLPRPMVNAPYVTTPPDVVDKMLQLATIGPGDLVYDLGCGDGRIVIGAASQYGSSGVGFDIDPERVAESRKNAELAGVEMLVRIEERDVLKVDLSPADVVVIYLLPKLLERLVPQLETLGPGARIVSHDFPIEGLQHDQELLMTSKAQNREHLLYLYTVPLKKVVRKPAR